MNQCIDPGSSDQNLDMTVANISNAPVVVDRHGFYVYPEIKDASDSTVQTPVIYETMYRVDPDLPRFVRLEPAESILISVELSHYKHYTLEPGKSYYIKGTYYRFGNSENKKKALQGTCYSDYTEMRICP